LLLVPVAQARLTIVTDFAPSGRGQGGFGSTGIN
jgi:dUTP pyrophosphatase